MNKLVSQPGRCTPAPETLGHHHHLGVVTTANLDNWLKRWTWDGSPFLRAPMSCLLTEQQERSSNMRKKERGESCGRTGEEMVAALLFTFTETAKIRNRKLFANGCAESAHW